MVAEEAVSVVDAFQALSGLAVAVPHGIGVDVVAALAGPAGPDRPILTQRVPKKSIVAELTALTCTQFRPTLLASEGFQKTTKQL